MTIPKDKLPTPLKTTAVTNLTPWPTQQKVKDLAADAGPVLPPPRRGGESERKTIGSQRLYPQADHRAGRKGHRESRRG